jgi:hypothetical protein
MLIQIITLGSGGSPELTNFDSLLLHVFGLENSMSHEYST